MRIKILAVTMAGFGPPLLSVQITILLCLVSRDMIGLGEEVDERAHDAERKHKSGAQPCDGRLTDAEVER